MAAQDEAVRDIASGRVPDPREANLDYTHARVGSEHDRVSARSPAGTLAGRAHGARGTVVHPWHRGLSSVSRSRMDRQIQKQYPGEPAGSGRAWQCRPLGILPVAAVRRLRAHPDRGRPDREIALPDNTSATRSERGGGLDRLSVKPPIGRGTFASSTTSSDHGLRDTGQKQQGPVPMSPLPRISP
jgi:hypothetical protein